MGSAVTRCGWYRAVGWAAVILTLTGLPYVVGWLRSTPEARFGGIVYDLPDAHSYLAKMRQGAQGNWLLRLPYTPEAHDGGPFYFFYLLLGKLSHVLKWPMVWGYQLARICCGLLLLLTVYGVVRVFTPWSAIQHLAYLLVGLGSGFGWLAMAVGVPSELGHMPLDLWSPDGFAFVTIYGFPHMCFSQAMLLAALTLGYTGIHHTRRRYWIGASAATLLATVVHPHMLAMIFGILGAYSALRGLQSRRLLWSEWIKVVLIAVPSVPYVLWALWTFSTNRVFAAWRQQGLNLSPSPGWVVTGYGLLMILAVLGVKRAWRSEGGQFVVLWAGLNLVAAYVPFSLQRRLVSGLQVPLATLASIGLVQVFLPWLWRVWPRRFGWHGRYSHRGLSHLIVFAVVPITALTNLVILGGGVWATFVRVPGLFHSPDQLDAAGWLADHSRRSDVVLCSLPEGNFLPTRAALHTVLGLDPETVDFNAKSSEVQAFFCDQMPDAERQMLLERYRVRYVLYGPNERALGRLDPDAVPHLERAAEFGSYLIYLVKR